MLEWEYNKIRSNKIDTYTYKIYKNEIPLSFQEYYFEFMEIQIKNNPNVAQRNAVLMKYYVWDFIKEHNIYNLHNLLDKYDLFEFHLNNCYSPITKKTLTFERKRNTRSAIHTFANFCYKKNKEFSPHKRKFFKNYKDTEKEIYLYDKNKKRYTIDLNSVPESYYNKYVNYIKYRESSGYAENYIYGENRAINYFWKFINTHQNKNIILNYNINDILELTHYIKTLPNSMDKNKLLSSRMQNYIYTSIVNFIKFMYYQDNKYEKVLLLLKDFSINRKNTTNTNSIPNDVLEQIIDNAKNIQDNLKLKVFILLSAYYGLRMSELINLKIDCIRNNEIDTTKCDFHFYSNKTDKHRVIYKISNFIAESIKSLIKETKELREEANSENIFLTKHTTNSRVGEIRIVTPTWLNKQLKKFILKNNIVTEDNKIPYVTSKIFRTSLPQFYEKKGITLQTTQQVLGHKNISTTDRYYNKTNEYEYEISMQKAIDNITCIPYSKNNDVNKYVFNYQDKKLYNSIEEGYCTNEETNNGKKNCIYLEARGNCYGCTNMVTTPEYLPFFRKQIDLWTKRLKDIEYLGSHVSRHLTWKIGVVKEIILRLERIKNV